MVSKTVLFVPQLSRVLSFLHNPDRPLQKKSCLICLRSYLGLFGRKRDGAVRGQKDACLYHPESLANLRKEEGRWKESIGNHIHKFLSGETGAVVNEAMMSSNERSGLDMGDEAMKEKALLLKLTWGK